MNPKADVAFEVSWEVCNKVGGIYTVIMSKAARMVEKYGENYYTIGPYFQNRAVGTFQEEAPNELCKDIFNELNQIGIVCHFGKWLIQGSPNTILIDFVNYKGNTDNIKKDLWEYFKIDSIRTGNDYNEPVVWAQAVGILLEKLSNKLGDKKVVAQFHEWLSGPALLYLKEKKSRIAKVFTTHATTLGRTLASSNADLYNIWDKINPDEEAYKHNVEAKHLVEKNSALMSDIFTTVSEITGMEAQNLLNRKPDVLLPNGLDISKFPTFEDVAIKHRLQRDKIREFLLYYFFPYHSFDIKHTLFYFIAARNEYHTKGIDAFIQALSQLNQKLKEENSEKTIVAFIYVPGNPRNVKSQILENKTFFQDIKDELSESKREIYQTILYSTISHKKLDEKTLFKKDFLTQMKIKLAKFEKKGTPPLSTHDLYDESEIINGLNAFGLNNSKEDKVKVVYYPIYLTGADGLLDLNYYEAMQGCHLGVFPSYYEPWGYTPLEAGALGVSSITTDLSGFGRYFCAECAQEKTPGVYIVKRLNQSYDDTVKQLVKIMHDYSKLNDHDRITNKLQARKVASTVDWKSFVNNYIKAHNQAVEKVYGN